MQMESQDIMPAEETPAPQQQTSQEIAAKAQNCHTPPPKMENATFQDLVKELEVAKENGNKVRFSPKAAAEFERKSGVKIPEEDIMTERDPEETYQVPQAPKKGKKVAKTRLGEFYYFYTPLG